MDPEDRGAAFRTNFPASINRPAFRDGSRARQADVRSPDACLSDRSDSDCDVYDRPRNHRPLVLRNRHPRFAPRHFASSGRSPKDREGDKDQPVPGHVVVALDREESADEGPPYPIGPDASDSGARGGPGHGYRPSIELILAARQGNVEQVRRLLASKADVDARQGDGASALHWASYK